MSNKKSFLIRLRGEESSRFSDYIGETRHAWYRRVIYIKLLSNIFVVISARPPTSTLRPSTGFRPASSLKNYTGTGLRPGTRAGRPGYLHQTHYRQSTTGYYTTWQRQVRWQARLRWQTQLWGWVLGLGLVDAAFFFLYYGKKRSFCCRHYVWGIIIINDILEF